MENRSGPWNGEENNAASIVTLMKSRGKTFLFCK